MASNYNNYDELVAAFIQTRLENKDLKDHIKVLEKELEKAYAVVDDLSDMCAEFSEEDVLEEYIETEADMIRRIHYCTEPGKEKVIVLFTDGTRVIKDLQGTDHFDLNVGVALCIAEHMYGSKSKFHKAVRKVAGISNKEARALIN